MITAGLPQKEQKVTQQFIAKGSTMKKTHVRYHQRSGIVLSSPLQGMKCFLNGIVPLSHRALTCNEQPSIVFCYETVSFSTGQNLIRS